MLNTKVNLKIENMNDEQEMGGPMVGIDSKERKIDHST